jgi:hypothetical protein
VAADRRIERRRRGVANLEQAADEARAAEHAPSCREAFGRLLEASERYGRGSELVRPTANPRAKEADRRAGNAVVKAGRELLDRCGMGRR